MKTGFEWKVYRTRFLVQAKQLTAPMAFTDVLGRDHFGEAGDYLVRSSDGTTRIAPKAIFEDIYVPMEPADQVKKSRGPLKGREQTDLWKTGLHCMHLRS